MLELPMTSTPDGLNETTVPDTVTGLPPGETVVLAMLKPDGLGVIVWSPIVNEIHGDGV